MKFVFKINKTANKFHFISNLTEWHFSARKSYNEYWIKKTGKLTKKEKSALISLTKILKKYNFGKDFLGKPFTLNEEKDVWKKVEKWVNRKEFVEIKNIFDIFDQRFEKIWELEKSNLDLGKLAIEKALKSQKVKKVLGKGIIFFKSKNPPPSVTIYILIGCPDNVGGGANIGTNVITVEFSKGDKRYIQTILIVILHEILHLFTRSSRYYQYNIKNWGNKVLKLAKQIFKKSGIDSCVTVGEAIISSWLPEGYVSTRYFRGFSDKKTLILIEERIKKEEDKFQKWRLFSAKGLYFLAKDYFKNNKPIDKKFFDKAVVLFNDFKSKCI